jgi:hypothetical protein
VSTHYFRLIRRGAPKGQRSRLLERLLAGADSSSAVSDWRADGFRVIAPTTAMPGIGAAALCAERERVAGGAVMAGGAVAAGAMVSPAVAAGSVFVATPVHYVADMSSVRLPAGGILPLRRPEAEALAIDFNRVWHDAGLRLIAGRGADLLCAADQTITVATRDPEDVLDQPIENYLPAGAAAARLRGLMSEIEMWLFEHAVNGARTSGGAPAVTGLWLWGGGPALTSLPPVAGWTAGEDVFFRAFESAPGSAHAASSAVLVIDAEPGMDEWRTAETWLESSAADLAAGRIDGLKLSAGNRCFSVSARWRRRFWRRSKSWQEYFA